MNFNHFIPVRIISGKGRLNEIGIQAKAYGKKALIVTTNGRNVKSSGLVERIQNLLQKEGISSEHYYDISPNPLTEQIDNGGKMAEELGCDMVIALGGGSAMDAAKGIAAAMANEGKIWEYTGIGENNKKVLSNRSIPIICVTTTSGTGSHISPFAVFINSETEQKASVSGWQLFPKLSIVDPELMISMPAGLTAATGFDAFAHALEGYTSGNASPMADIYAESAIKLISDNLVKAMEDPSNIELREKLALADTLAGMTLSLAGVTLCHAISHAVGAMTNAHHGEILAILTPATVEYNMSCLPDKFKAIGYMLKNKTEARFRHSTVSDNSNDALPLALDEVIKFQKEIGMNKRLSDIGVREEDLDLIAQNTLDSARIIIDKNVRKANHADIVDILKRCL